jgi:hypothetical protein
VVEGGSGVGGETEAGWPAGFVGEESLVGDGSVVGEPPGVGEVVGFSIAALGSDEAAIDQR